MSKLKITIDREACGSCDVCVDLAAATFEMDDEAKAIVKNPDGDTRDDIVNAAESCPMGAIVVEDAESGEKIAP